eukprot:scaffold234224_cov34-Tisochrysis_lutea.AAC.3
MYTWRARALRLRTAHCFIGASRHILHRIHLLRSKLLILQWMAALSQLLENPLRSSCHATSMTSSYATGMSSVTLRYARCSFRPRHGCASARITARLHI